MGDRGGREIKGSKDLSHPTPALAPSKGTVRTTAIIQIFANLME